MIKKVKIGWYTKKAALQQMYSEGMVFAFVSKDNKQICPFVLCKDYFQDAIQGFINNQKRSIYGFTYDPHVHLPICLEKTKIIVANAKDPFLGEKIPSCLDFINQIEAAMKMTKTTIRPCSYPSKRYAKGGIWLFQGNARWMISPPMISLYTLLIRTGVLHTVGDDYSVTIDKITTGVIKEYQNSDRDRMFTCKKGIQRIIKEGDRNIFGKIIQNNYPKNISVDTMHNDLGIVAFSEKNTSIYFPQWHAKVI